MVTFSLFPTSHNREMLTPNPPLPEKQGPVRNAHVALHSDVLVQVAWAWGSGCLFNRSWQVDTRVEDFIVHFAWHVKNGVCSAVIAAP